MTKLQRLNKEAALKELKRKGEGELGLWPEDYCGCEQCYKTVLERSGVVVNKACDCPKC